MSVEQTDRTIRGYLDDLLGGGDFARFFSEDVVWTTMETGEEIRGRGAVRDFIVALHTQWFRAEPELKDITVADGLVGLEALFVGTHAAEFAGIAPTGLEVRLPYSVFYDVADGEITALRAYFPIGTLVARLQEAAAQPA